MKHRRPLKITSRISSVTNGFVQAILPDSPPSAEQRAEVLVALDMSEDTIECVYCGDKATDWDHLRPLVVKRRPSGFLTNYKNLVPSCGPCNQSKSGQDWERWIGGKARNSPASRGIPDIEQRVARLREFVAWSDVRPVEIATIAGPDLWGSYWEKLSQIEDLMREAQENAVAIRSKIQAVLESGG